MRQFLLPFELPAGDSRPTPRASKGRKGRSDDQRSFEERDVQNVSATSAADPAAARGAPQLARELLRFGVTTGAWPAALTWQDALTYTSLSEVELRRGVRRGLVRFRCVGRRGSRVAPREQLDRLIAAVFGPEPSGVEEAFDFG